ncbi:MAG: 4Fe-4S dicluster domain-containing protein [Candidatus Heimdallarchaeaceae archaeon]
MSRTKIEIEYTKCGSDGGIDPRECTECLRACDPAIFLMHEDLSKEEENRYDPQNWMITAVWLSKCTRCLRCVEICPEKAIDVTW